MGLSLCRPKSPAPEPGLSLEELFEAMPRDPVFLPSTPTYADVLAKLKKGGTHHVVALCIEEPNLARFEAIATMLAKLWRYKPENITPIAMIPEIFRSEIFPTVKALKEQLCLYFVTSEPQNASIGSRSCQPAISGASARAITVQSGQKARSSRSATIPARVSAAGRFRCDRGSRVSVRVRVLRGVAGSSPS